MRTHPGRVIAPATPDRTLLRNGPTRARSGRGSQEQGDRAMMTEAEGGERGPDEYEKMDRLVALAGLESWLERPMQVLGLVWLGLLVIEFTRGVSPLLTAVTTAIWVIFILAFALRLALAPDRARYL